MHKLAKTVVLLLCFLSFFSTGCAVNSLLYPVPSITVPHPAPSPFRAIRLQYDEKDSVSVWLRIRKKADDSKPIVVFFHGNGENLALLHASGFLNFFIKNDLDVAALDYPGYGRSSGSASEQNLIRSANSLVNFLRKKYPGRPLMLAGWSLGAAVAFQVALRQEKNQIAKLVVMSPWLSLEDVAAEHYPRFLVRILLSEKYNSYEAALSLKKNGFDSRRILVIHGESDGLIPFKHGLKLAETLACAFFPVENAGHNDLLSYQSVLSRLLKFLKQ